MRLAIAVLLSLPWAPRAAQAAPRGYDGATAVPAQAPIDRSRVAPTPARSDDDPPDRRAAAPGLVLPAEAAPLEPPRRGAPPQSRRVVRVDTNALGGSTREDAFHHAGARTVIPVARAIERGAASVGEALDRVPGVRALDGIAGSSGPTKLNVAVRGASPRLAEDATVLLDEVPIGMAPYGQPQLSLFPVSLFSIDRVDAVRSGAAVRFGPTTVGGVFNLVTKPIPTVPEIRVASRVDRWGNVQGAASMGTTVKKLGVWAEYAPQGGRTFREHSEFVVHSGLLKLAYALGPRAELASTTHGYFEDTSLPGGITLAQYGVDPFSSTRDGDRFRGWRIGEALKFVLRPRRDHEFAVMAWYNRSARTNRFDTRTDSGIVNLPRDYHVVGVEPRYAVRLSHRSGPYHMLGFGVRGVFERGHEQRFDALAPLPPQLSIDEDTRLGALAVYAEDELYLADESVVLRGGVRGEFARLSGRDNLEAQIDPARSVLSRGYAQALPSASIRYDPIDEFGVFLGYSRSFKAPTFYTVALVETNGLKTDPITADSLELGLKLAELGGFYGEATGWARLYRNILDEGEATVDYIGSWYGGGAELDLEWEPGEVWDELVGSSLYGGWAWVDTTIVRSSSGFNGNAMPWFPRHEAWAGLAYAFPFRCSFFAALPGPDDCRGLQLGADLTYSGKQFSYFDNDGTLGPPNGATGVIPAYTLVDVYLKFRTLLPRAWAVNLSLGVKNIANTSWFYRTDDLNRGILAQRPRTFFIGLDIAYTFFGAPERARARQARREARQQRR